MKQQQFSLLAVAISISCDASFFPNFFCVMQLNGVEVYVEFYAGWSTATVLNTLLSSATEAIAVENEKLNDMSTSQ